MGKWFKARVDSLLDNIIFTALVAVVALSWAVLRALPVPVIVGIFVGVFIVVLFAIRLLARKTRHRVIQIKRTYEEDKGWEDGKSVGECGLIITNHNATSLTDCQARLIDLAYETPHSEYSLENYPRAEDLVCPQTIAAFGDGKIPLFRWKDSMVSKSLELVYKTGNQAIGYVSSEYANIGVTQYMG